jgi:endonuclease YncB( thermonuclease family)
MKQYLSLILLLCCLFSCNGNSQKRTNRQRQIRQTENTSFQIKKGVECDVRVIGITDGDTFKGLTYDNQQVKCRVFGIELKELSNKIINSESGIRDLQNSLSSLNEQIEKARKVEDCFIEDGFYHFHNLYSNYISLINNLIMCEF